MIANQFMVLTDILKQLQLHLTFLSGEMVLKCGDTWNYEDSAENQTYIEFDCSGTKFKLLPRGIEDATLNNQRIDGQDEKEWHGASNTFFVDKHQDVSVGDNNPSLIDEFYFVKPNGDKVKFEGTQRKFCAT